MTEEQLQAIEARPAAATEGPWECGARRDGSVWISMGNPLEGEHLQADWDFGLKNGIFTTHAREDVPALVREVRRLQAHLQSAQAQLRSATAIINRRMREDGDR